MTLQEVSTWWERRSPREQRVLLLLSVVVLLALVWQLVLVPITDASARARELLRDEVAQHQRMQVRAAEIAELARLPARRPTTGLRERAQASLGGLDTGGDGPVIEASGADEVRIRLATVRFDALVVALQALLAETGARAAEFSVVALETPGLVRAELLLTR
jgi:type II secretory pathway component PulM